MADAECVRVLPSAEVEAMLTELTALISTLPNSLPIVPVHESKYGALVGYVPDSELVEDRGEVGALNTTLERAFGHRKDGLQIAERGKAIESIVPLLEKYLKRHPSDIILQKWLLDFVSAARELRPKRVIKQTEKAREGDSKRKAPDTSNTSISVTDLDDISEFEHSFADSEASADQQPSPPEPKLPISKKKRPAKRAKKSGPSPDAIPDAIDERYTDIESTPSKTSQGGAPRNELADELVISCYVKGEPQTEKSHRFRCIASSLCDFTLTNTRRQLDRIFRHAVRCRWLRKWKPELHAKAEVALANRASGSGLGGNHGQQGVEATEPVPMPDIPEQRAVATRNFFAPFNDQGKLDNASRINLAIVRLLCFAGIPPRVAESRYWKLLFYAVNPHLSNYTPPSSTTLRDSLIPAEARQAVLNMRRFLKTQRNLSISFDGLTEGSQPVYTVHVSTSDRQTFLLRGDVFYGAHTADYITGLLDDVVTEIGVEQFASVVSDDTNVTKKARRDLVAKYPTIINLADPCHKLNLVIQDICADSSFTDTIAKLRALIKHFNHSTSATSKLKDACTKLGITTGLKGIGKTRFATVKISAVSAVDCMPGLYRMNRDGDLEGAPQDVRRITKELTRPAITFLFDLKKLISILEAFSRPLLCLESSHATIGDNHLMWMAGLARADDVLNAPDSPFDPEESARLLKIINSRFKETINTPPSDVYILGSFGDPRMRGMRIYLKSNPLASSILLPASHDTPHLPNTSPCDYISDVMWTRIRKAAMELLKNELELAEKSPLHPLSKYVDAQLLKSQLDSRLVQYACTSYPFDEPLGQQTVLEYWSSYMVRPDTKVIGFIFTKLFSAVPNSMNDERTGSRMTFLYSKLRSRTDANTMVEQIQVKQWYQLMDEYVGNVKRPEKNRPVLKFRQLSLEKQSRLKADSGKGAVPVALDDEEGDDWLEPGARSSKDDVVEKLPSSSYDHLEFVDLKAASLADFLSDTPLDLASGPRHGTTKESSTEEVVRKVADINWD